MVLVGLWRVLVITGSRHGPSMTVRLYAVTGPCTILPANIITRTADTDWQEISSKIPPMLTATQADLGLQLEATCQHSDDGWKSTGTQSSLKVTGEHVHNRQWSLIPTRPRLLAPNRRNPPRPDACWLRHCIAPPNSTLD